MQTLHFTLPAPDCLPPALEMLQLSLHSQRNAVTGKRKNRFWVTDGQEKQGLAQLLASSNGHTYTFFVLELHCFRNQQQWAPREQKHSAKHEQEQGQPWYTWSKAKPGNCFSKLSRLQPLPKPDSFNQSSFQHCHEAKSCAHSSLHF